MDKHFAASNGNPGLASTGVGANYLDVARHATGPYSEEGPAAYSGIKAVLDGSLPRFSLEYPCHSPSQMRWFLLTVSPLEETPIKAVVSHLDITSRRLMEDKLRASDERFQELARYLHQVFWIIDAKESKIVYVSPGYEKLWGRSCQSLLDNPYSYMEGIHQLDQEMMIRENAAMFKTGHVDVEARVLRPDGSLRWVWIRGYPVTDAQGQLVRFVGVIDDITERKRAVEQLQSIADHVIDGIISIDEHGTVTTFNPAAERIFGYFAPEVMGQNVKMLMPDPYHSQHDGYLANYLRTGEAKIIGIGREVVGRHKDGSTFLMKLRISRIGQTNCFTGIVNDITERKAFEDSQARLAAIIECSDDAIVSFTLEGIVVTWNHGAERLYGYLAEEIIGRDMSILHTPENYQEYLEIREKAKMGERIPTYNTKRLRKDGSLVDISLSISPILVKNGVIIGVSKIAHDITRVNRLEEQFRQVQKMEAVGTLAGGVAHDFNNLLTIINGYSEMLITSLKPDDPIRALLGEIHKAGESAGTLTRQLLAFSRRQVLEPKVLNLNAVVANTEMMLRRLIGEDVILTTVLDPALKPIKVDPGQIQQVLMNLAVNARDAMPQGGRLNIETRHVNLDESYRETHPEVQPGAYSMLAVTDTGTGMDEATKARIFEPFFTTKERWKGTGLGMAVVHGVVKQSGGHVEVYSELGQGTAFKVYFPVAKEVLSGGKSSPGFLTMPTGTETILLVEDADAVRALSRHVLQSCGYTLLEASNGREALLVSQDHQGPIHLAMSDVVMPHLGGRQLAERLSEMRPGLKMLFVSGYTDDAVVRHGILEADVAFLQKPFTPSALAQKVREVLDNNK